ncbi:DUF3168 domain-containing protein [Stappia stellulata]|uniref:DUF3168 domain-containing protein n=1 Tax=Stappia stellulata TaxID=71235 RepID=UPI001CD74663|nr:DUF3168 domain-containing protein [Stappia stellulata]MCA1241378.1 DUF3168 domain-containing protein [Stappia stellulata]
MSAQADLRGAIVAALRADAALTAVIGADRVHDGAPRGAAIPFVDLGAVETRLLAATPDEGERHIVEVLAYSRKPARGEVSAVLTAIRDVLAELGPTVGAQRLVHVSDPVMRSERQRDGRGWRGRLSVRIVTEPAA